MFEKIPVVNPTSDLSECRGRWFFDETHDCWCLEDVLYTQRADVPKFQRLSVFVPKPYLNSDGTPAAASRTVPVVFENNSAGYMQMPHTWLGGPRCYAEQYLKHGLIYVTCGCRGRESRNERGEAVGKAPASLVDLKTAIRFLRHNREALPGDFDRIISVGWSAGGAMSALLGVTGDNSRYESFLRENGAYMEESDAVYAAQIYCPIIDLEHADLAYEWCFGADKTCEDSPAGSAETMTPFKEALSRRLAVQYAEYINSLHLKHPRSGEELMLSRDGRGGSFYEYMLDCLSASASDYLARLDQGELPLQCTVPDYLEGRYRFEAPAPFAGNARHAGPGEAIREEPEHVSLGDLVSRPPAGVSYTERKPEMVMRQGDSKREWLSWDGIRARVRDLDTYVLQHRRRMKPCTSFDKLTCDSAENQVFGSAEHDFMHFNPAVGTAIAGLREAFPEEAMRYENAYDVSGDAALMSRVYLINPLNFIGTGERSRRAEYFRIRAGAGDADTSFSVAVTLAVKLANTGCPVDYAMVWDQPHSEADYPGEILQWIDTICK